MSWAPGTLRFFNIFLPNTGEDQKKVLAERGAHDTVPYVKSIPGYCITFIKRLDESLSLQLLEYKPLISLGLYVEISWQTLNEMGPCPLGQYYC